MDLVMSITSWLASPRSERGGRGQGRRERGGGGGWVCHLQILPLADFIIKRQVMRVKFQTGMEIELAVRLFSPRRGKKKHRNMTSARKRTALHIKLPARLKLLLILSRYSIWHKEAERNCWKEAELYVMSAHKPAHMVCLTKKRICPCQLWNQRHMYGCVCVISLSACCTHSYTHTHKYWRTFISWLLHSYRHTHTQTE